MAPSTPTKSHQKKKKRRSDVVLLERQKRHDLKSTPKRKQHAIAAITQVTTPSDASTLTPSVCTPRPPSFLPNTNIGIEALILREGAIGSTKPVAWMTGNWKIYYGNG